MQKSKFTAILLIFALLFTLAIMWPTKTTLAQGTTIEWLTLWTEPEELMYWGNITAAYETATGVTVKMTNVEADVLYQTILTRHAAGEDPDILSIHATWLPMFANWRVNMLAKPPSDVAADISDNYIDPSVDGSTFKGFVWGYPTEFNSHALVYNSRILEEEGYTAPPATWTELEEIALACTTRGTDDVINQTGFMPYINGPEELRFEFMNLLWANNGEYLDLKVPEAKFNSVEGVEVLQLFHDLSDLVHPGAGSYHPDYLPDVYWTAWADETLAMVIIPSWFTYVRDAMGDRFYTNLGVAPVPIGPHGTTSASVIYNWLTVVTQRAEDEGRAGAAWDFLKWLNAPRSAGYISVGPPVGPIPKGTGCSIIGDFLIYDSIMPSRIGDQENGRVNDEGVAGDLISDDFWFKAFIDIASDYGESPKYFAPGDVAVQEEVALMMEKVAIAGDPPQATADAAAARVNPLLPMAGDIDMDGPVNVYDAVRLVKDWYAKPGDANWWTGRSDINDDGKVTLIDAGILVINYGRVGNHL